MAVAVAAAAFTFVPALRTDASAGPRGERRGESGYHAPFGIKDQCISGVPSGTGLPPVPVEAAP